MSERVLKRATFSGRLLNRKIENDENKYTVLKGVGFMLLDIALVLAVTCSLFFWFSGKGISPYKQAFPCGDEGIRKPFKENTVGLKHLLIVSLASPLVIIGLVEGIIFFKKEGTNRIANYFSTTTIIYLKYLLVYAACTFAMEFLKCYFGRLRPHFVDVCKPDWTKVDCTTDPNRLIDASELFCTNPLARKIRTARTSFPSGHTAAAFHVFLFVTIYLFRMASYTKIAQLVTVRNIIVPIYGVWAVLTAISRVTDYWHHKTDVLGGVLLAIAFIYPAFRNSWNSTEIIFKTRRLDESPKNE